MPTPVKLPAMVKELVTHGEDVFSLRLTPLRPMPAYQPGQFLHLALDAYDPSSHWPESRVFSIATSPTRASELRVTFAVKGPFTRRMATNLRAGEVVWLKLPYGDFILRPDQATDTALIAGGTGITPFVAFLELLLDRRLDVAVHLFYGVRKEALLLYRSLLDECARQLSRFRVHYFVELPEGSSSNLGYGNGRLSIDAIMREMTNPFQVDYYLSGPPQMIQRFSAELLDHKISSQRVHIDAWD